MLPHMLTNLSPRRTTPTTSPTPQCPSSSKPTPVCSKNVGPPSPSCIVRKLKWCIRAGGNRNARARACTKGRPRGGTRGPSWRNGTPGSHRREPYVIFLLTRVQLAYSHYVASRPGSPPNNPNRPTPAIGPSTMPKCNESNNSALLQEYKHANQVPTNEIDGIHGDASALGHCRTRKVLLFVVEGTGDETL